MVGGRAITLEAYKKSPAGWKRPFVLEGKPKWLKTDFNRWDDDLEVESSDDDEGDKKQVGLGKNEDLRQALREVEMKEKLEREARQRELEESLKKKELPPPREEVKDDVDLDGID